MGLLQAFAISGIAALVGGIVGIGLTSACASGKISDLESDASFLRHILRTIWLRRLQEDEHGMAIQLEPELADWLARYVKEAHE